MQSSLRRSAVAVSRRSRLAVTRSFSSRGAQQTSAKTSSFRISAAAVSVIGGGCLIYLTAASGTTAAEADAVAAATMADIDDLRVDLAGKTNSAFVFIKPHACNDSVTALVRETFAAAGIRITSENDLSAETIDKQMLIDNHYGAIAAKAVKLSPSELHVPEKGQAGFEAMFGESWASALASGQVYNAKQACAKLGIDGKGLDAKWATTTRGVDSIKFGGGFYCAKIDGIYIMNGFYMSMRSAYTTPPAKIHTFTVQWPTDVRSVFFCLLLSSSVFCSFRLFVFLHVRVTLEERERERAGVAGGGRQVSKSLLSPQPLLPSLPSSTYLSLPPLLSIPPCPPLCLPTLSYTLVLTNTDTVVGRLPGQGSRRHRSVDRRERLAASQDLRRLRGPWS